MSAWHERAVEAATTRLLEEPESKALLHGMRRKLETGFYPEWFVDVVMQRGWSGLKLADAFAFANIWAWVQNGDVALVRIGLFGTPAPDAEIETNRARLSTLVEPFKAEVWNGTADSDGFLSWDREIALDCQPRPRRADGAPTAHPRRPGRAPLEIGLTRSSRTFMHLAAEGAVARWPYGHDFVTLLIVVNQDRAVWAPKIAGLVVPHAEASQ